MVELQPPSTGVQHFLAPSGLEVPFPLRVVRIGHRLDLDMPDDWRVRFVQ